jgi:Fe-Mn family superoxide dismutase
MQLHYQKHHQAYVTNLNIAQEKMVDAIEKKDISKQIELQQALKFNGGGHINHSIFWTNLASPKQQGGQLSSGTLKTLIERDFKSLEHFQNEFAARSAAVQGSGWGWLGFDKQTKQLKIATTGNQDPLLDLVPLLGVDVWEHAYYLQYKNVRPDYLKAIWNVINWQNVESRLLKVI